MSKISNLSESDYDYNCGPFVYDADVITNIEKMSNNSNNDAQHHKKTQLIVKERSSCETESVSNVFTIADVFNDAQCREIIDYVTKNSALCKDERDLGYAINADYKVLDMKELVSRGVLGASHIDELIFKCTNAILNAFRQFRFEFKGEQDDGYILHRIIGGGGGTNLQTYKTIYKNSSTKFVPSLSIIIALNDDYDGGMFNFPNQNINLKLKKGEVILFPPYWTHPYSISSIGEKQIRHTINTFILDKFID
jgi:hypothetical protein